MNNPFNIYDKTISNNPEKRLEETLNKAIKYLEDPLPLKGKLIINIPIRCHECNKMFWYETDAIPMTNEDAKELYEKFYEEHKNNCGKKFLTLTSKYPMNE